MKKQSMITLALLAVLLLVGTGYAAGAAGAQPGSNADPLVSKSYVDEQVASIQKKSGYEAITLSKGKQLVCAKGAQVVVTTGAAKATGSLSDLTEGKKVAKGKAVSTDHSFLVLKENTGVKATKSATVFVQGHYSIK